MAKNVLVAVFSASGVTERVGKEIARIAGADFFLKSFRKKSILRLTWTG